VAETGMSTLLGCRLRTYSEESEDNKETLEQDVTRLITVNCRLRTR
jgi:hypothetical protein